MLLLAQVVFAVWVLAVLLTVINLVDIPRLAASDRPQASPLVSVVIPARDEAAAIGETVRRFLEQTYADLEVIVVDDRSSDGTAEVARSAGRDDPRLAVLPGEALPMGWLGKPWALEQGARRARGELLLFVDADVRYAPTALAAMVAFRERSGADLVAVLPRLELRGVWEHVLLPQLGCFLLRFTPVFIANRSQTRWLAAGGGIGNLVRRRTYERCGTHEALRDAVVDDVGLARLIRTRGGTTRVALANALISIRVYEGFRAVVNGFTKNVFAFFGPLGSPVLMGWWLVGHVAPHVVAGWGLMHWLTGVPIAPLETWALASVGVITLSRVVLFSAVGLRLDNALLGEVPMTLGWCYILARSLWYGGVRKRVDWRGRRYTTLSRFGSG